MVSINGKEDEKTTGKEHYSMNKEEDGQNNHYDDVMSINNRAAALGNVEGMELITSIESQPIQLESMKSSSDDAQCQDEVKKSCRRKRRHSFQSNNCTEGGGSSGESDSPLQLESDSLAPGAYHEGGTFAQMAASSAVQLGLGGGQQDGSLYHEEYSDSDLMEEGISNLPHRHLTRPSQGSTTDTDLNSLVPVDSTPGSSNVMAVVQAHVVVEREESLEERLAAEIEARLQAEFRGQVEQEVNRTLGAMATAEVIIPDDHDVYGDNTPGNDIVHDNTKGEYRSTTKIEIVDIDGGEQGLPSCGLKTCCTKWRHLVPLLLLLLTGATVGIVIGILGGHDPDPTSPPASQSFCQVGPALNGKEDYEYFGDVIALSSDGNRVAIGAPDTGAGLVRIFDWSGTQWIQLGSDLDGKATGDQFGFSLALSSDGSRVAIGASSGNYNDTNGFYSGQVRIFDWSGSNWTQVGLDLDGDADGDEFGVSVALSSDGSRVAIGADQASSGTVDAGTGYVRILDWSGGQWVQVGSDIFGEAFIDLFGTYVALSSDGNRMAIAGVDNEDDFVYLYIFDWSGSDWTILGEAIGVLEFWSAALSADGGRVAVGGSDAPGNYNGLVRLFGWLESNWTQVGSDLNGEAAGDFFGVSVALSADGNRVAIGAPSNDQNAYDSGQVHIFDWSGSDWTQVGSAINGEALPFFLVLLLPCLLMVVMLPFVPEVMITMVMWMLAKLSFMI